MYIKGEITVGGKESIEQRRFDPLVARLEFFR
jgi:hypothetical protein